MTAFGTIADKAAIDEIGGALAKYWDEQHQDGGDNPYSLARIKAIKKEYSENPDATKQKYKDIFYYYDGLVGTKVSQSIHPAGMVISPVNLRENYGVFNKDGDDCLFLDMDECHDLGLVKYDFLCLVNVKIIKETCEMLGIPYPKSYQMNWNDEAVWKDMLRTSSGIFQMESDFAFQLLSKLKPKNIVEMSHITAAIRPAGASYRDDLVARKRHDNGSKLINDLLDKNYGFLIYQEDVTKFLTDICGFSGGEADTMRRAIAKKKVEQVNAQIPKIIDGYCASSDKPRAVAEKEAQSFIRVMQDAGDYMFNYSHSVAYCLIGYMCAYFRYYHPVEFITALLNNAKDSADTQKFTELARVYGITITAPKFGISLGHYAPLTEQKMIAKGMSSIKGISDDVANKLADVAKELDSDYLVDVFVGAVNHGVNSDKLETLMKVDFFDKYGNFREVNQIYRMFKLISAKKSGLPKTEVKDERISEIIGRWTNFGLDARGRPSNSYKFPSMEAIRSCMRELESFIKSLHLPEIAPKVKIANYLDILGYVPATNKAEDRFVLIILDITPIHSKNGNIWQYRVNTQSLGSGKTARLSVSLELYNRYPLKSGTVVKANVSKDEKGYWHLSNYALL